MPFRIRDAVWLKTETDRVQGIILMPKYWHRAWTHQSLKVELETIGLVYSTPEIIRINGELHLRGVVEDVSE